jgi:hypothetical protein
MITYVVALCTFAFLDFSNRLKPWETRNQKCFITNSARTSAGACGATEVAPCGNLKAAVAAASSGDGILLAPTVGTTAVVYDITNAAEQVPTTWGKSVTIATVNGRPATFRLASGLQWFSFEESNHNITFLATPGAPITVQAQGNVGGTSAGGVFRFVGSNSRLQMTYVATSWVFLRNFSPTSLI